MVSAAACLSPARVRGWHLLFTIEVWSGAKLVSSFASRRVWVVEGLLVSAVLLDSCGWVIGIPPLTHHTHHTSNLRPRDKNNTVPLLDAQKCYKTGSNLK